VQPSGTSHGRISAVLPRSQHIAMTSPVRGIQGLVQGPLGPTARCLYAGYFFRRERKVVKTQLQHFHAYVFAANLSLRTVIAHTRCDHAEIFQTLGEIVSEVHAA
jgi:hypothetical protein